jgi:hypothetical protein
MTNCNTKPCGCSDQPVNTPPPCNESGECEREPCSEIFCEDCIIHCQPDILIPELEGDKTPELVISQGMRWSHILQLLLIREMNPMCVGFAAENLRIISKTSNSITLSWITNRPSYTYILWYNTIVIDVSGLNQITLTGLIPDTEYEVYIKNKTQGCLSPTIRLKTLTS